MQVPLEIPEGSVRVLREEYRRQLGSQFPLIRIEDPGPAGTTTVRYEDDPDVDPIELRLQDFIEDEVARTTIAAAERTKDAAMGDEARKDALLDLDNARRDHAAIHRLRQERGARKQ